MEVYAGGDVCSDGPAPARRARARRGNARVRDPRLPALIAASSGTRVLTVTGDEDWRTARQALDADALGYLVPALPDGLTSREVEILCLLAAGHTDREAGDRVNLSVRTVEAYRGRIQLKTGRSSRADLVRYVTEHRLEPSPS